MHLNTGRWTADELDRIIRKAAEICDPGERIAAISEYFLNTPYQESTLVGSDCSDEELVLNLGGIDCFTFLDYVDAMRLSSSYSDMQDRLREVRYRGGLVSYRTRNHFFTDWAEYRSVFVRAATQEIGQGAARHVKKVLNQKADGSLFLKGLEPLKRTITYIPAGEIGEMLQQLKTGDYAGIYSESPSLDVSHVGILVRVGASILLRHASSSSGLRKVVDQGLLQYMEGRPGLIILRPI